MTCAKKKNLRSVLAMLTLCIYMCSCAVVCFLRFMIFLRQKMFYFFIVLVA